MLLLYSEYYTSKGNSEARAGVIRWAPIFIKFYWHTQPCPLVYVLSMADLSSCGRDHRADNTINDNYLAILHKRFEQPWPIMINNDRIQNQNVWVCILALPGINFVPWVGQLLWIRFLFEEGIIIVHKLHRAVGGVNWTGQVRNLACKCKCAQDTLKI